MHIEEQLRHLLGLPRQEQLPAARSLIASLPAGRTDEAWNSRFGPDSLFDAWTRTDVATRARQAKVNALRPKLDARPAWRAIEVGGGNGALWRDLLRPDDVGELIIVDPVADATARVAAHLPDGVSATRIHSEVQGAALPDADVLVCSLTLHHVAGTDAQDRARHGLAGPGKVEVLTAFAQALRQRGGTGVLVEADVNCDIDLAPGDPALADNLFDSYVRRCTRSMLNDLDAATGQERERLRVMVRHWFLEQILAADVPVADRDVYERTVPRWMALLRAAGLQVVNHHFTDDLPLFHLYEFTASR